MDQQPITDEEYELFLEALFGPVSRNTEEMEAMASFFSGKKYDESFDRNNEIYADKVTELYQALPDEPSEEQLEAVHEQVQRLQGELFHDVAQEMIADRFNIPGLFRRR